MLFTIISFAQTASTLQNGFTNKDEAKNQLVNGLKNGKWIEYRDANFNYISSIENAAYYNLNIYKAGLKINKSWGYYISGELFSESTFINGKINGVSKNYYKNGVLKVETSFVNGMANGTNTEYYESGKLLRISNFVNDKENGTTKTYYENGTLKAEKTWINGVKNGLNKEYYQNGQISIEKTYDNDQLNGIVKEYYESGELWVTTPYLNGKINGIGKKYDEGGVILDKWSYTNGIENSWGGSLAATILVTVTHGTGKDCSWCVPRYAGDKRVENVTVDCVYPSWAKAKKALNSKISPLYSTQWETKTSEKFEINTCE